MNWAGLVVVFSSVGIACTLGALLALAGVSMTRGHWWTALTCLAAFAVILFLLLAGVEYADNFWEGK